MSKKVSVLVVAVAGGLATIGNGLAAYLDAGPQIPAAITAVYGLICTLVDIFTKSQK